MEKLWRKRLQRLIYKNSKRGKTQCCLENMYLAFLFHQKIKQIQLISAEKPNLINFILTIQSFPVLKRVSNQRDVVKNQVRTQ